MDALELDSVAFDGNLELLIADPPYNTRGQGRKPNSKHDVFTKQDQADLLDAFDVVLRPGGHGCVFCPTSLFAEWAHVLESM